MRYRMLTAAALLALVPAMQADAEVPVSVCGAVAGSTGRASEAMRGILEGVNKADLTPVVNASTGALKAAAQNAQQARSELVAPLKAYIDALEDLSYQLKVCARG